MALIQCRECGQTVSDQAERCPHCGSPLFMNGGPQMNAPMQNYGQPNQSYGQPSQPYGQPNQSYSQPNQPDHKWLYAIIGALGMAVLAGLLFAWKSGAFSSEKEVTKKDTVVVVKETNSDKAADVPAQQSNQVTMIYSNSYDGFVNIRQQPSAKSAILGSLTNNGPGAVFIANSGSWYKVNYNGIVGYVKKEYAKVGKVASSPATSAKKVYYVVIGSWESLALAKDYYAKVPDMLDNGPIYKGFAKGKVVYRMCIAECSTRSEAQSIINSVKNWNSEWGNSIWIWESDGPAQCVYNP